MKKSEKATVKARVFEVTQIRLRGAQHADVVKHAEENGWNVGERQIRNYIAMSDQDLEETLEKDRQKLLNRHLAQRQTLYAHSFQAGDYSTAKAILQDEAALLGLYPPKRSELTGKDGAAMQLEMRALTDDERRLAITAILETGGAGSISTGEDEPGGSGVVDSAAIDPGEKRIRSGRMADALPPLELP